MPEAESSGPPRFITFEGGEGSGKSTQATLLSHWLQTLGYDVVQTREPGGTEGAEAIRGLLVSGSVDRWTIGAETLLHTAARLEHVAHVVLPALKRGAFVVCDRFIDSTIAYQGIVQNLGADKVLRLHADFLPQPRPALTLILDLSPETGLRRAQQRDAGEDRYERMGAGFHDRLRAAFHAIAEGDPARCRILDADRSVERVHADAITAVVARFRLSDHLHDH